jgi:tetratricopeptide (TPR) repeat protein
VNTPLRIKRKFLFILPFFGIFVTYRDLLLGPSAGHKYYYTFATLILAIIVLGKTALNKKVILFKWIDATWLLFLLYISVNFWVINRDFPFYKYEELLIIAMLYLFFRKQFESLNETAYLYLSFCFALLSFSICVYAFMQYFGISPSHSEYFSFTSFFNNPTPLAIFLTVVSPYLFVYLLESNENGILSPGTIQEIVILISLTFSLVIIFLTYSRTSWMALGVMAVSYYILFKSQKSIKVLHTVGLVISFFLSIGLLYYIKPQSAKGRILNYIVSFDLWQEAPYFGVGWNNFGRYYNQFQASYFKSNQESVFRYLADDLGIYYNEFVRITAELGIIGLLLFIVALVLSINWNQIKSSSPTFQSAVLSMIGILTTGIFSYPLSQTYVLVLFVFNLSILAYYDHRIVIKMKGIRTVAIVLIPFVLALLYNDLRVFRNSIKWDKAYNLISQNRRVEGLNIYADIYPELKSHSPFLYNYGYELSLSGQYLKSLKVLQSAQNNMVDLNLFLRKGYVHKKLGHYKKAEGNYLNAKYLIPSRLVPRYLLMKLYQDWPQKKKAVEMAKEIMNIAPKVNSEKALFIKNDAERYLGEVIDK